MVLGGPTGGVVWFRPTGRSWSIFPRPFEEKEAQETPDLAPVAPTQTSLFFADAPTVTGKSPGTAAGAPTILSLVGFSGSIANMETVLDPALTANKYYFDRIIR